MCEKGPYRYQGALGESHKRLYSDISLVKVFTFRAELSEVIVWCLVQGSFSIISDNGSFIWNSWAAILETLVENITEEELIAWLFRKERMENGKRTRRDFLNVFKTRIMDLKFQWPKYNMDVICALKKIIPL